MISSILGSSFAAIAARFLSDASKLKIHVMHAVPGRLRLQCNTWKNSQTAVYLEQSLNNHPLINHARVSPITGSMVLEFHQQHITQEQFNELLNTAVQSSVSSLQTRDADTMIMMRKAVSKVDHTVKTQTLGFLDVSSLIVIALTISGFINLGNGGSSNGGYRNLLWAYRMLRGEGGK